MSSVDLARQSDLRSGIASIAACEWFVGAQERRWPSAARCFAEVLIRYLGEASGDAGSLQRRCEAVASIEASVAPVRRHRFEAHRAAFEHGLQLVDAAIALSQTLGPAEAVSGAIAHAKLFEAEPAAWRIVDEPKLLGPSAALGAEEIGP